MIKDLHMEINKLYRQLGKEFYEQTQLGEEDRKVLDKRCRQIAKRILKLERLKYADIILEPVTEPEEALVQETTEEGIPLYRFCKHCNLGNPVGAQRCKRCGVLL
ncbi:hypothetical protein [Anaerotalea alkaliphila]|uniref:Uncharacterized protein n=1 Tax=Anaerotalea alkaliphila TaxID=2662126 RepID=A0A7X5KM14_9FIRM|nr:hypothetical protein [Anaerotalea alkaliphila]NDL67309.1 hypothetical protein [Anaerotalea alkaliphila]